VRTGKIGENTNLSMPNGLPAVQKLTISERMMKEEEKKEEKEKNK
jgi:hypothetical protein